MYTGTPVITKLDMTNYPLITKCFWSAQGKDFGYNETPLMTKLIDVPRASL